MDDIPTFDDLGLEAGSSRIATRGRCSEGDGRAVWVMEQSSPRHGGLVKNRVCMVVSLQQLVSGESTAMLQTVS